MTPSTHQYDQQGNLKHLLAIASLKPKTLNQLLDLAQQCIDRPPKATRKTLANLFFEPSTRTRCAFELAATQLGWHTLNLSTTTSAAIKGESFIETLHTLGQMPIHAMAIRHQDNNAATTAAQTLQHRVAIINAGSGTHEHPTQALTDMLTIRRAHKTFDQLKIAIVGDINHSRVARSNIHALSLLNVPEIRLVAPKNLMPTRKEFPQAQRFDSLSQGIKNVDVIMMLRLQRERMSQQDTPELSAYQNDYCLQPSHLSLAKSDAIIMHPGPVNPGIEMAKDLIYAPQSHILKQVAHGIAVRMAVMHYLTQ